MLVTVDGGVASVSVPSGVVYWQLDFDNWENPDESWASRSDLLDEVREVADPSGADGAEADWAAVESRLLGYLSNPWLFGSTCSGCADQPVPGVAAGGGACEACSQYPADEEALEARDRVLTAAREFRLDADVLERLVSSPGCPPDVAGALAAYPVERVQAAAAAHPATPPEALVRLAEDPESSQAVLAAVARNPSAPPAARAHAGLRSG